MGDDCNAPNPKTLLVSPSLTDPVALGQMLTKDYLPLVAAAAEQREIRSSHVRM
jgi:hypothetical protein